MTNALRIDSEFKALIPALTAEEYAGLEESILKEGCRDALVVWSGIIIDGHNRFEICQKHGLEFKTSEKTFADRDAVKLWIIDNQLARRNLQSIDRIELNDKKREIYERQARERQGQRTDFLQTFVKSSPIHVDELIAKDAGVSRETVRKYRAIKDKPEAIESIKRGEESIHSAYQEVKKQQKKEERENFIASLPPVPVWDGTFSLDTVNLSDISDLVLPTDSIDLIFTDPPYHDEYLDCYRALSGLAGKVLKPGAYCFVYAGKMFLPDVLSIMCDSLEYIWTVAVFHPFSTSKINKYHIFENWRPVLIFRKPGSSISYEWVQDVVRGERDKEQHAWQQDLETPLQYIEVFTKVGDIVLDPFIGGGTTAVACQRLKRHFLAFDNDEDSVKLSIERLSHE